MFLTLHFINKTLGAINRVVLVVSVQKQLIDQLATCVVTHSKQLIPGWRHPLAQQRVEHSIAKVD